MAFLRTANAIVVKPNISPSGWGQVRGTSRVAMNVSRNLATQATEILGQPFDPNRWLLTHCTIVASVDTVDVPNVKLGSFHEGNRSYVRKYADFRITSNTVNFINNNLDSFERKALLKSYRTFIGAHNFLEHTQIEDLSKGRIIDAVPRDIGDSVYIDILVATERKHTELVKDIESGRMNGLSMGCSTLFTICSKCGNVAEDETQLCDCIKYNKGNSFIDERGQRSTIAEICGHHSIDPTAGITFIEASWVANPAFTGAVARNILSPESLSDAVVKKAQQVLSQPPAEWVKGDHIQKAAAGFDFGDMGDDAGGGGGDAPDDAEKKKDPSSVLDKLQDDVLNDIVERVHTKILDTMSKKDKPEGPAKDISKENDAFQKSAALIRKAYSIAVGTIIRNAHSDADVMDKVAMLDAQYGMKIPVHLYRTALSVGSLMKHGSAESYLRACGGVMKRKISASETNVLLRLGKILNHVDSNNAPSSPKVTKGV